MTNEQFDQRAGLIAVACIILAALFFYASCAGATVYQSQLTPDGAWRIERSDQEWDGILEVYRCQPLDPPERYCRKISGASMVDWDSTLFRIAPDSQSVWFIKGCLSCNGGGPFWAWWYTSISHVPDVDEIVQMPGEPIYLSGFESGTTGGWQ
jgi:hypothetical protein